MGRAVRYEGSTINEGTYKIAGTYSGVKLSDAIDKLKKKYTRVFVPLRRKVKKENDFFIFYIKEKEHYDNYYYDN